MTTGYRVPSRSLHRSEHTVRRSRFITSVGRAPDPETAHAFVATIQEEMPDATHHCWGFVAGPPGSTARVGMSDAGEPHGTAGRPILNTLLHSDVGEVVAVVTRYFGGGKLGKGGLGRAYADAVARGLETLPTSRWVERVRVRVEVPFGASDALYRLLDDLDSVDRDERYGSSLEVWVSVPRDELERLEGQVAGFTAGRGEVAVIPSVGEV